eukprot:TRINITY_DN13501_c0_g1_i5.p1 TRINITY_DN13501_c0_g1~~TRINITY_DN13501_c0_g1_i5.p1  ORF type:complete len:273 (-),score=42.62 TRINITY_DN13501_c0_g1_i5:150-968(-)
MQQQQLILGKQFQVAKRIGVQQCRRKVQTYAEQVQVKQVNCPDTPEKLRILPWTGNAREQQALQSLQQGLQGGNGSIEVDEEQMKWFLRDRAFDVKEAQWKLMNMLNWRRDFRVSQISEDMITEQIAMKKAYVWQYTDKYQRPVIVLNPSKHFAGAAPHIDTERLCTYMIEKAVNSIPEGQDNIIAIFDMRGYGPANTDLMFVKFLVDLLFVYYPKRVGRVIVVDAPWVFKPVWQLIKPMLRKYSELVEFGSLTDVWKRFDSMDQVPEQLRQ